MCISAVTILIFFIPYTASGFKAIGTLFNSLYQIDYHTVMIIGAVVVVGYTVMGGFMAVFHYRSCSEYCYEHITYYYCFLWISVGGGWDKVTENAGALEGY